MTQTIEDYLHKLQNELQSVIMFNKQTPLVTNLCQNIKKCTTYNLKRYPRVLKFIGEENTDHNLKYKTGLFGTASIDQCKQNLRNLLANNTTPAPISAQVWNETFSNEITLQNNIDLSEAMKYLNRDFKFNEEAYEQTVQRNDSNTSPEINKIKAQNNIEPLIALLLNGNPTFERMKPYYENLGIKDKVFYGQAWLNIKRACNSGKVGKLDVFKCGERFKEMLELPQVQLILIKFEISQKENEKIVLQKKKDEIDTINANVRDLPGIILKLSTEKPENYEAQVKKFQGMLEFNKNRQQQLIADLSIPTSEVLFEQINKLETEIVELRKNETILLDKFNSSSTDPIKNVSNVPSSSTLAGGRRKRFSLRRRHSTGKQITRQKRKSKSKKTLKKKRKVIKSTRQKRFF